VQDKTEKWLTCSVVFSLFPVLGNLVLAIGDGRTPWPHVLIGHGEFLLVSIGVAATAAYDLAATEVSEPQKKTKMRLSTLITLTTFAASLYYANFVEGNDSGLIVVSLAFYASALICGYWCLRLSEGAVQDAQRD
jgi:hypothetical protein